MVELGWLITIYFSLFKRKALRYQGTMLQRCNQVRKAPILAELDLHSPRTSLFALSSSFRRSQISGFCPSDSLADKYNQFIVKYSINYAILTGSYAKQSFIQFDTAWWARLNTQRAHGCYQALSLFLWNSFKLFFNAAVQL